jgi:transcriptional regulator with XRE-family HTH domain
MGNGSESDVGAESDVQVIDKLPAQVARMVLGRRLRELRERAGTHAEDAALRVGLARASLWRMENGDSRCRYKPGDMELLARCYRAEAEVPMVVALANATRANGSVFRGCSRVLPAEATRYFDLEAHAQRLRWCAPYLVPDLLRTTTYVAAAARAGFGAADADLEGLLEVQSARQRLFDARAHQGARCEYLIDEAVLDRPVGGAYQMGLQLHHILASATVPHVSVRVSPVGRGLYAGFQAGAFVILDFPEVPRLGALPSVVCRDPTSCPVTRPADVVEFEEAFDDMRAGALDEESSRERIREAVTGLGDG